MFIVTVLTFACSSDEVNVVRREVGQAWLASSKIAIKASHFQTAYSSILQAQQNGMPFSFVQGCKLTRALGEPLRALQELAHSVRNVPPLSDTVEDGKPNPELRSMAKVSHTQNIAAVPDNAFHRHYYCELAGCMKRIGTKTML